MGRYMAELGLTPSARSRIKGMSDAVAPEPVTVVIRRTFVSPNERPPEPGVIEVSPEDSRL